MTTTPRTWVVGEVVTAAELNTEIRDQFSDVLAGWTAYSPSWTSTGTAPSLGNGSLIGRYRQVGQTVTAIIEHVMGSTTTFGTGTYRWSLPVTAYTPSGSGSNFVYVGSARGHGGAWYTGAVGVAKGGTTASIYSHGAPAEWGPTQPFTWTASSSSYLHAEVTYEAA